MDVRIIGVPVIDADPVELRAEVLLHLPHQVAGEGLEVCHLDRVLRRDDEAEMVPVVLGALGEGLGDRRLRSPGRTAGPSPRPG